MALKIQRAGLDMKPGLKVLITGHQGGGKTLMASTFPDPFFASIEGGMLSLAERETRYAEITGSKDMDEIIRSLRQTPEIRESIFGGPVNTLVIDTLDVFQKKLKAERMKEQSIDLFRQQDWGWLGEKLSSYLEAWFDLNETLGINLVVTCHLGESKDEENGRIYYKPLLEGAIKDSVGTKFDIVGILDARAKSNMEIKSGLSVNNRTIERNFRLYPDVNSPWLKDRSGKMPLDFPVNLKDDYDRIHTIVFVDWDKRKARAEVRLKEEEKDAQERSLKLQEMLKSQADAEPEPVKETPPIMQKANKAAEAEEAEKITNDQFTTLVAQFNSIADDKERTSVKNAFKAEYGNPMVLPSARLAEATAWIEAKLEAPKDSKLEELKAEVKAIEERPVEPEAGKKEEGTNCADCGEEISDPDVVSVTTAKFGVPLCRADFRQRGKKKD